MKKERKNFSLADVRAVYEEQGGVCANEDCHNPLKKGFQRHHKDGDHSNNSRDNLALLCDKCHHAKKGVLEGHTAMELGLLEDLDKLRKQILEGKVSGSVSKEFLESVRQSIKISLYAHDLDTMEKLEEEEDLSDNEIYQEGFREGLKSGVQLTISLSKGNGVNKEKEKEKE